MSFFSFELLYQSKKSKARVGRIHTPHGVIDTPSFVAVGTNGTIKTLDNVMVEKMGLQLMFCNTYHLLLQPGTEVVEKAGGLHKFINRSLPLITDSGGFQVFSLAYGSVANELKSRGTKKTDGTVLKIDEDGVTFRSYRDGRKIVLTPESSVETQKILGADIIIPFDELPPYHISPRELKKSLARTHRWEERSLVAHKKNVNNQAMYAVIHGGIDYEMRKESADFLSSLDFDGFAIGGSIGKNRLEMLDLLNFLIPHLTPEKPRHLLGIGDLESLEASIPLGIDTFDSSYPTRAARHGVALTKKGHLKVVQAKHLTYFGPLENDCACYTCHNYSCSYLAHLFKAKESTAGLLTTIHNLHFMIQHMNEWRVAILDGRV